MDRHISIDFNSTQLTVISREQNVNAASAASRKGMGHLGRTRLGRRKKRKEGRKKEEKKEEKRKRKKGKKEKSERERERGNTFFCNIYIFFSTLSMLIT